MKKVFLLLLVGIVLTTSTFAQTFSDLPEGHWAKGSVEAMVNAGIISGYTDGTFRPSAELSRIHSLLLLARIAGINENSSEASKYASTYSSTLSKYSTQYKTDVAYLLGTGVLNESDLDSLLADDKINAGLTREEMAMLITKVLGKEKEATSQSLIILSFNDASSISAKAKPYVHYVSSKGYMNGMDSKNFGPKTIITRAQAASIFQRIYKLVDIKPTTNNTNNNSTSTQATSFLNGTITKINTSAKSVSIKDSNGNTKDYTYDSNTEFYVNSTKKTSTSMAKNAKVSITLTKNNYITIMNISEGANVETTTISGTISSFSTSKKTISIKKSSKTYTYEYDTDTKFTLDGKSSTVSKALVKNYEITATVEDNKYISTAKVTVPTKTIIGKIIDADRNEGYIIIEDDEEDEYILMDEYIDEYTDEDEDFYFDDDTDFYYNGSSKSYSSISSTSYLYREGYYVEITIDEDDYIETIKLASSKSNLNDDEDIEEIIGKIVDADRDEGYIIIEDDDEDEYILMDEYIDEYTDDDEDFYFDDDTDFYYNGSSKSYSSISSTSYLYREGYYVKITIDEDDYIKTIKLASSKSNLTSSSSSTSNDADNGFIYGYVSDWDEDYIEIIDDDDEEYSFEIESHCVIIKRSSDDPEDDLYYYDDNYDDILDEDDEVVVFICDEDDGDYYTSLIILLD